MFLITFAGSFEESIAGSFALPMVLPCFSWGVQVGVDKLTKLFLVWRCIVELLVYWFYLPQKGPRGVFLSKP